ncbi:B-box zinc finger protein 20-like [Phalaenopsis equestris]|uniref:B-box zinc finger protein 20-like n=1 Tax=Phalaenopsis equestris TaxID=78828 RepID=UPI0009E3C2E9|nr:B-box zinc finger protein 20-like [Phalaenopsis equestris]
MKILCDVCCAGEATVLCCADEAALCYGCDLRVHSANKLAGKHPRFSLLSAQPHPLCDTCQERRGFVFCKDDRAILFHECDSSIHTSNGLTMKHSRFILTGTRLSSVTSTVSSPLSEQSISQKKVSRCLSSPMAEGSSSSISEYLIKMLPAYLVEEFLLDESVSYPAGDVFYEQSISQKKVSRCLSSPMAEGSSSISEYLTKMLPGYLVEDFLLDDSVSYTAGDVFYQSDALAPVVEGDVDAGNIGVASAADWNFFVPEAPLYQFHPVSVCWEDMAGIEQYNAIVYIILKDAGAVRAHLHIRPAGAGSRPSEKMCGSETCIMVVPATKKFQLCGLEPELEKLDRMFEGVGDSTKVSSPDLNEVQSTCRYERQRVESKKKAGVAFLENQISNLVAYNSA